MYGPEQFFYTDASPFGIVTILTIFAANLVALGYVAGFHHEVKDLFSGVVEYIRG